MTGTPPFALDPADPVHAEVLARLTTDQIGWFTTVRADGSPHAVPVWFLWHAGRLLVRSEPRTAKVSNVRRGSAALLHLHTREAIAEKFHVVIELEPTDLQAW